MEAQIYDFKINLILFKYLGISPLENLFRYYHFYSKFFIIFFVIVYDLLFTINFYFIPRQLDIFIGEMIFYFTKLSVVSKVFTFVFMRLDIKKILIMLQSDLFQPKNDEAMFIVKKATVFIKWYYKILAATSVTWHFALMLSQIIPHVFLAEKLELPVCSYAFLPQRISEILLYPLYFYQSVCMHIHVWYNVNIDTLFLGLLVLTIVQLEILDINLRTVTNKKIYTKGIQKNLKRYIELAKLNECIIHYDEVRKFCDLIQKVFSVTLFIQITMASCIICVCLVRFTMPAPLNYYIFVAVYMFVMILQIFVPCWFGTCIINKSTLLSFAIYDCDWTTTTKEFKSNMRIFVERANKPLLVTGGKMFLLSLTTFSSIMNSAYSFYTLLQNVQSKEN